MKNSKKMVREALDVSRRLCALEYLDYCDIERKQFDLQTSTLTVTNRDNWSNLSTFSLLMHRSGYKFSIVNASSMYSIGALQELVA